MANSLSAKKRVWGKENSILMKSKVRYSEKLKKKAALRIFEPPDGDEKYSFILQILKDSLTTLGTVLGTGDYLWTKQTKIPTFIEFIFYCNIRKYWWEYRKNCFENKEEHYKAEF